MHKFHKFILSWNSEQDQDGSTFPSWSCWRAVYKPVWHTPLLSVQWINSWWWTDELPETCRVSCQNKFVKLVHLVGFIIKKFVTMHGHMNVKNKRKFGCMSALHALLINSCQELEMFVLTWSDLLQKVWIYTSLVCLSFLTDHHQCFRIVLWHKVTM